MTSELDAMFVRILLILIVLLVIWSPRGDLDGLG